MVSGAGRADIVLAIHAGERESHRWSGFLASLARICSADAATLAFARAEQTASQATVWSSTTTEGRRLPDGAEHMRPERVYALEELAEHPSVPGAGGAQAGGADELPFGRLLRVMEPGVWSAWLAVFRRVGDLSAADSALLTALAPHLAIAMGNFAQLEDTRLRAAITEDLVSRANISWRAVSADGRVIASAPADASWTLTDHAKSEQSEIARLTEQTSIAPAVCRTRRYGDALALPIAPHGLAASAPSGVTLAVRVPRTSARAAHAIEQLWSLTPSEARLVSALAAGNSLTAAAANLGITIETARNYSKRIYAKTGTSGQADLVRLALTSIAALA